MWMMSARGTYETVPSSATCRTRSAGLSTRCEGVVEGGEMTDKIIPVNSAVCYVGHKTNGEESCQEHNGLRCIRLSSSALFVSSDNAAILAGG